MRLASSFAVLFSLVALSYSYETISNENPDSEAELLLKRLPRSAATKRRYCYCPLSGQGRSKCFSHEKLKDDPSYKLCTRKAGLRRKSKPSVTNRETSPHKKRFRKKNHRPKTAPSENRSQKSASPSHSSSGAVKMKTGRLRKQKHKKIHKKVASQQEMMQSDSPISHPVVNESSGPSNSHRRKRKRKHPSKKSTFSNRKKDATPEKPVDTASTFHSKRSKKRDPVGKKSDFDPNQMTNDQPIKKQDSRKFRRKKKIRKTKKVSDTSMVNDQPDIDYSTEYCRDPKKQLCLNLHTMNNERGEAPCKEEQASGKEVLHCEALKSMLENRPVPAGEKAAEDAKPKRKKRRYRKKKVTPVSNRTISNRTKSKISDQSLQKDQAGSANGQTSIDGAKTQEQINNEAWAKEEQALIEATDEKNDKYYRGAVTEVVPPFYDLVCMQAEGSKSCYKLGEFKEALFTTPIEKLINGMDLIKGYNTFMKVLDHMHKNPSSFDMISRKINKVKEVLSQTGISEDTIIVIGSRLVRSGPCQLFSESLPIRSDLFPELMIDCDEVLKKRMKNF